MAHSDKNTPLAVHRRLGPQASRAVKRVCQYLNIHNLKNGGRLPSHQEMAAKLGVSNDTLMAAMRQLTACGMLERRTRVGTILANDQALPHMTWSVGIVTVPASTHGPVSIFADLTSRLQTHAAEQGWRTSTYYRFATRGGMKITDFGPLAEDLADGLLDALIVLVSFPKNLWDPIHRNDVVVYHSPFDENAPCGLIVDEASITAQATDLLVGRACQSLATVRLTMDPEPSPRSWQAFEQTAQAKGLPASSLEYFHVGSVLQGSRNLVEQLLARPEQDRPEGLIVMDDYLAQGLTEVLAQQGEYRPHIAVSTHLQRPLGFHLPVVRFEVDLHEMTRKIIQDVGQRLFNPALPQELQYMSHILPTQQSHRLTSVFVHE